MRQDVVVWCAEKVMDKGAYKIVGYDRTTALFWAPKPLVYAIMFMLNIHGNREEFLKIATMAISRNTKIPVINLVRDYKVRKHLTAYKVNPSNLNYRTRPARYRFVPSDRQHHVVRLAMREYPDEFKKLIMHTLKEEYRYVERDHQHGRRLDPACSPAAYAEQNG